MLILAADGLLLHVIEKRTMIYTCLGLLRGGAHARISCNSTLEQKISSPYVRGALNQSHPKQLKLFLETSARHHHDELLEGPNPDLQFRRGCLASETLRSRQAVFGFVFCLRLALGLL